MRKKNYKIYGRVAFILLAIMVSGLLNIYLLVLPANAAQPIQPINCHFAFDGGEPCADEYQPESNHSINYPSAPIPECCLTQYRYYDAIINTDNDRPNIISVVLPLAQSDKLKPENNSTYNTSRLTYPPPETLALAATVIRE